MVLRRLEYKVVTARTAEEAMRMMETSEPDAVLTDASLPGMSGTELLARIKKTPRLRDTPVIVLGAEDDQQGRDACKRLGCADWFTRNVEPDVLYRALQTALESRRHFIRLATSHKVIVGDGTATGGPQRTEFATEISEGGLFIRSRYPQPLNTILPVRIDLNGQEIRAKVVVLYSSTGTTGPSGEMGMGVKFVEISDRDRGLIRKFIKDQLTHGLAH
jgi:CheY-like chemotaxis protein